MKTLAFFAIALALASGATINPNENEDFTTTTSSSVFDEKEAKSYLEKVNEELGKWLNKVEIASWKYDSNLTAENLEKKLEVSGESAKYNKKVYEELKLYQWQDSKDPNLKRQFSKLSTLGAAALPDDEYKELQKIISEMENIYATAKICDYHNKTKCDLALEPEITEILEKSRDPKELEHVWVQWHKVSGETVKNLTLYPRYVELSNQAAKLNGFSDNKEFWLRDYEDDEIESRIEELLLQVKPLYLQIHAYVRSQLNKIYKDEVVSKRGPIPAHLLKNMWAQSWNHVAETTLPYPGKKLPDITEAMVKQGYDTSRIFKLAESCFVSMNLSAMPESFWKNSILEKPKDREIVCHASAWDFYDSKDFRIKQCTRPTMEFLMTTHHEMGHVEYFLSYKDLPTVFKEGANPGFHEAVGDLVALSVSTPAHLKKIGLLESEVTDKEADLNHLYDKALSVLPLLPFAYVMDKWRWNVFSGITTPDNYNCNWWKLREEIQGIEPPVDRTEEEFDAAAKYHIAGDVEYLRYFISHILQFQFHRSLCMEAGEYDPKDPKTKALHLCDITSSTKAGNLLKSTLEMGSSKPWQDAMEKLTGQRKMDGSGLLEYFAPLHDWLVKENEKNGEFIGWESSSKSCVQTRGELMY